METKHTPGPWRIEQVAAELSTQQHDFLITYSDGTLRSHVARLFDNSLCDEHGTTDANARLIAASPDLLAALERASDHLIMSGTRCDDAPEALAQARAAIAKAKG